MTDQPLEEFVDYCGTMYPVFKTAFFVDGVTIQPARTYFWQRKIKPQKIPHESYISMLEMMIDEAVKAKAKGIKCQEKQT